MATQPSRSVISRVVETVRDTGSMGQPPSGMMPGRHEEEEMGMGGGGEMDTDMNDEF